MILVTGGLGTLGVHTARALADLGAPTVLAVRTPRPMPELLSGAGHLVVERADCTDSAALLALGERYPVTAIVHLAAPALAGLAPLAVLAASGQGMLAVLDAAQRWGARLVFASTIGVYAGSDAPVYREDAALPVASVHPLPAAKKSAEIVAAASGVPAAAVRIGAIWGPLGRPASPFFGTPQLVHAAVRGTPLPGPVYADDAIDQCYVRDCGRALAALATAPLLRYPTYNLGSGRTTSNAEVAAALRRTVGDVSLTPGRGPHAAAADPHLDITRLREDTGFTPAYDLDRAIADYATWLRAGHPR
jgi:UDP-glucose 4-epimerase